MREFVKILRLVDVWMKETIYNEEEGDIPLLCPIQWVITEEEVHMPLLSPFQWVTTGEIGRHAPPLSYSMGYYRRQRETRPSLVLFNGLLPETEGDTPLFSPFQWVITGERGRHAPPLSYSMGNYGGRGTHTPP